MSEVLTFTAGGSTFTLCDSTTGDVYTRLTAGGRGDLNTLDLEFAGVAGRELRIIGSQQSPETALGIAYGQSAGTSVIYKANAGAMETFLNSIAAFRLSTAKQIGTLVDRDGTYTGMRWVSFNPLGPARAVNHLGTEKVYVLFEAGFSQYRIG